MGGAYCEGDGGVHCQDRPWPRDEEVLKRVNGNVYFLVSSHNYPAQVAFPPVSGRIDIFAKK